MGRDRERRVKREGMREILMERGGGVKRERERDRDRMKEKEREIQKEVERKTHREGGDGKKERWVETEAKRKI